MSDIKFLIGADPELFVRDPSGNLVSAFGMIPGTKDSPFEVEHGAVQVDGMALEFNIDPASTVKEFNRNITAVLAQLKEMIPPGYQFDFSPVAHFGQDYIDAQPEEAKALGCTPDFNAQQGGVVNPSPNSTTGFRTASGHIHIGWTRGQDIDVPEHMEACIMAVKQLDVTLGVAQRAWDRDIIRSQMYGKFGAFRPKHYGVEYRTLSNTWVNDADRRSFVFHTAMAAMEQLMEGNRIYEGWYTAELDYNVSNQQWRDIMYIANRSVPAINRTVRDLFNKVKAEDAKERNEPAVLVGLANPMFDVNPVMELNPVDDEDDGFIDDIIDDLGFDEDEDEAVGF